MKNRREHKQGKPKALTPEQAFKKFVALRKTLARARRQVEELTAEGAAPELQADLATELGDFAGFALDGVAQSATVGEGNTHAVQVLAGRTSVAAKALSHIAREHPDLAKQVAEMISAWPVNYIPNTDWLEDLKSEMDPLGLGVKAPENVRAKGSSRPSAGQPHRHVVAKYALRMRSTLLQIHSDKSLADVINSDPESWPKWAVGTMNLPPLEKQTAARWFSAGWAMLKGVAKGNVSNISELRPVGNADAEYRSRRGDSLSVQEQQRNRRIYESLLAAFIRRS